MSIKKVYQKPTAEDKRAMAFIKKSWPKSNAFYLTVFGVDGKGLNKTHFNGSEEQLLGMTSKLTEVVIEKVLGMDKSKIISKVASSIKKGQSNGSFSLKSVSKRKK